MYKVAISDLDGTLLGPNHKVSIETKKTVQRWMGNDRKFVIATGRHYIEAKNIQDDLGVPMYLISSNGARVHDPKGEIILKQNLPKDIAASICKNYVDNEVQMNLFTDKDWFTNFELPELEAFNLGAGFYCKPTDFKDLDQSDTIKIFFWGDRDKLDIIYQQLHQQFSDRINLTFSLNRCLEVMDANANKGIAVNFVLNQQTIANDEAIAFGDGMNDLEMLSEVGTPILMANAQKDLITALNDAEMTSSSKEHGVAVKLNKLMEIE